MLIGLRKPTNQIYKCTTARVNLESKFSFLLKLMLFAKHLFYLYKKVYTHFYGTIKGHIR